MTHSLPISRPTGVAGPALVVTAALFALMQWLISTQEAQIQAAPAFKFNEITLPRPIREIPPAPPHRVPKPKLPPPVVHIDHPSATNNHVVRVVLGPVATPTPGSLPTTLGSGSLVPFLRVPPSYPGYALSHSIEGYVDLAFTVTAAGKTADIRVIGAKPTGIFERAATKAVEQWKYRPRMIDGQAIATRDVRTRVRFELKK